MLETDDRQYINQIMRELKGEYLKNPNNPWNYDGSRYEKKRHLENLKFIRGMFSKISTTMNVLEVGCALGKFTGYIAPLFKRIDCWDALKSVSKMAGKNLRFFKNVFVDNKNILNDKITVKYDLVLMMDVIYHVPFGKMYEVAEKIAARTEWLYLSGGSGDMDMYSGFFMHKFKIVDTISFKGWKGFKRLHHQGFLMRRK